ncbi:MAG: ABC-type transport auxiliary lipoprotein family protein [Candidatus Kapabacteria bacterium]|nr:ABC-type transport auxiliary lipoprotein family protein [Candidatus Kapabacteria bacterium]
MIQLQNAWMKTPFVIGLLRWCLLGVCAMWCGCGSTTFYPVLYGNFSGDNPCKNSIKLYLDEVTANGAIDDVVMQLQLSDESLRRDRAKEWRDTPSELFRQAVMSACVSERWKANVTLVANPAQADLRVTVHLRDFYVKVDKDEDDTPTGATIAAIVQFSPAAGKPSTQMIEKQGNASDKIANPYSAAMSRALSGAVDAMLTAACGMNSVPPTPPPPPRVVTIPAWDSARARDVGVVITIGSGDSGTISIRDDYGAPIHEWSIREWKFAEKTATFNVVHPWSITGATMELREEALKKGAKEKRLSLRFTKIPGGKELKVKGITMEALAAELPRASGK